MMQSPRNWYELVSNDYRLRSLWAVFVAIFSVLAMNDAFHWILRYEESETLLYAKQFADPHFLPSDWYFNHEQLVRRPYHLLVFPLTKFFSLPTAALLARLTGFAFVAVALALIAVRLRLHAVYACVIVGAFLWLGQSLPPGTEWIFKRTESKVFAYGLVFFSLVALMDRRLRVSALLAGAGTTMHIIIGGWGTFALGLTVLSRGMGTWKERFQALAMWGLGASVALYFVAVKLLWEPGATPGFDAKSIYVYFRMPHHLDPAYWDWSEEDYWMIAIGVLAIGILIRAARASRFDSNTATVAQFALWTLVPYACGYLILLSPFAPAFLQFYPFRMASSLVLLFALMIGIPLMARYVFREIPRRLIAAAGALFFISVAAGNFFDDIDELRALPSGGKWSSVYQTKRLRAACQWIQENTDLDVVLISSPHLDIIPYHCQRAVVVTYRMAPSDAAGLEEWYRRIVDFNGGKKPRERGYNASRELHRNFGRLPEKTYRALGHKYQGSYLIVRERHNLSLPRVYNNSTWTVYALDGEESTRSSGE